MKRKFASGAGRGELASARVVTIAAAAEGEPDRQVNQIKLIASENIVSRDALRVQGSVLDQPARASTTGG